jgi:ParB-like chromosome segregation protein Spo0J
MESPTLAMPQARINARLVEQIPISTLRPYPEHARTHSKKQIAKLSRSIDRFGIVAPILVDDGNVIIAGHAVVDAAKLLGLSEVPALRVEHLSEVEKRALRLALNRLAEDAEWDRARLAKELQFLVEAEFEVDLTGFELGEIDFHLEGDLPGEDELAPEDKLPPAAADTPAVTQPGDVWILGRHRLVCGDPREEASYLALLAGELAAVVFTDPPYRAGSGPIGELNIAIPPSEMSPPEYTAFLSTCFQLMAAHSVDGAVHFICTGTDRLSETVAATDASYGERLAVAVWDRVIKGSDAPYRDQTELVLVEKVGTAPIADDLGRRDHTTLWSFRGVSHSGVDRDGLALRPVLKPVALIADAILDVSRRDDIVLDPFAGSGTTVLAAEKTGRRARAMEANPRYCDVLVRRWQTYTSRAALLEQSGLTFEEVVRQRHRLSQAAEGEAAGSWTNM